MARLPEPVIEEISAIYDKEYKNMMDKFYKDAAMIFRGYLAEDKRKGEGDKKRKD